ncbi:DUF3179 domain-containing protein [Fulvivirga sp. M361]|uniref:DUF3179 domain-containing protein n=1 Tax=Fulvivirga sp. M361 TaxID=2594266 RepID=UPI001179F133|nr:DUF3179 domain-containing protein [Fulvivirga sp. M361]TRX59406.1 DUF3179 domain-containing protein [Fulvivirga sp. M361]
MYSVTRKPILARLSALVLGIFIYTNTLSQKQLQKNGFNLSDLTISFSEIKQGGPPKDGIPAINHPRFESASNATFIKPNDLIIGVEINGIAKAYPIKILNWHEIVNDEISTRPVVITYCALCRSGLVFNACVKGRAYTFGVSGLLYNSDVLLYDRETQSLWSQLIGASVAGTNSGKALEVITSQMVTWAEWKEQYPKTLVLSTETGYVRNYDHSPYSAYGLTDQLMFPVEHENHVLLNKQLVVGIELDGEYIAFPFSRLRKKNADKVYKGLTVQFDKKRQTVVVFNQVGDVYPSVTLYWFAWYAIHPDTKIFPAK